jgi:hypothetical protein
MGIDDLVYAIDDLVYAINYCAAKHHNRGCTYYGTGVGCYYGWDAASNRHKQFHIDHVGAVINDFLEYNAARANDDNVDRATSVVDDPTNNPPVSQ